jgi:adenine-specific DNA-methyltransferase
MNIERKKKLGAYYTPSQVTDVLSSWAIRSPQDYILEPSFGGCNFLTSALNRLKEFNSMDPAANIYGFDIDPRAFDFINEKNLTGGNFFLQDFLDSSTEEHNFQVSVILGNPPYLPIHKLESSYKKKVFKNFKNFPQKIPGRSSLWIYFIAHSLQYLRKDGRMAWIVPDSISFTGYGKNFLEFLAENFSFVKLISINERFFQDAGTKEKTAILICDGYQMGNCKVSRVIANSLYEGLSEVNSVNSTADIQSQHSPEVDRLDLPRQGFRKTKLGEVFTIRIGIVIGAAKLLTYKNKNLETNIYFPNYLYPIVTKGKQLEGISISREKLLLNDQLPVYLVDGIKLENTDPILFSSLVNSIPPKTLMNVTFRSRPNLFGYDDFNHPDAFLTFFSQSNPRVILNENKELNATNSVHRLYLKEAFVNNYNVVKWISIQLFAELFSEEVSNIARAYGDKIKKYEPSDASNIPIIMPEQGCEEFYLLVNDKFSEISKFISNGEIEIAKQKSLEFVQLYMIYFNELAIE